MRGEQHKSILLLALLAFFTAAPVAAEDTPVSLVPAAAEEPAAPQPQEAEKPPEKEEQQPSKSTAVVVRVGHHDTYDRVVFDWPKPVPYKVTRDGERITVHFSAAGHAQFPSFKYLTRMRGFTAGSDGDGHLTVSFIADAKAPLKDFFSESSIAVDVQQPSADAKNETVPAAPAPKVVAKPNPPPVEAVPTQNTKTDAAPEKAIAPPAPEPNKNPVAIGTSTTSEVPITLPSLALPISTSSPATIAPAPDKTTKSAPTLKIGKTPLLVASLDPHTSVRAAIWQRGGEGYVLFDRKLTLTLEALIAGFPAPLVALQPLDLPKASGFHFAMPKGSEIRATLDGTAWKIFLTKQQPDIPVSTSLIAQPDFALGARYILPMPDSTEPVRITDPVVGDDLIIVPLNESQSFSIMRQMAEFQIWPAAQGLVIKPLNDKIIVRAVSDGIEITSDAGLHLSPAKETGAAQQSSQKAKSAVSGKSIFDFAVWRGKSDESFTRARQRLQQTVVDVPERERDRARLELARFYFARGYGEEALALINYLGKQIPDLTLHNDFLALLGAANILASHPEEGLKDFDLMNIKDQPEIKLWQAVGSAQLRNWVDAEDKFAATEALLLGYPEPFYSRFFILAIESAIAVGNDREAADWLDQLESNHHNTNVEPAIEYLHGVLHAHSGRTQAASQAWKHVAASYDHLYKVRAELALIDLGVANLSLSPAQAADRLEALRFAWRGDDLEVDIMHRLGQFYIKAKNIKAGLAVLAQAEQLYPHSPMAPKIHDEMSQTFRDVFLSDLGKDLSPLEALTVYQQYRQTLMPSGNDGISVTRNLAERLTAIDLMDQAGDLLEDIARNKLKGEEKGRVAARLAAIRLIDHKPQLALDALDLSAGDFLPAGLQRERQLLRAKALSELHRDEEALAILEGDTRFPAMLLKADINMGAQHWNVAAKSLLDLVGPPPKPGETFREDQADWLVRAAIAMAMNGDQVGLDHLAIDYGAAMAGTRQNDTFRVLVQPEKPGQLRDISSAQSRIAEVDMFQKFLDSYRKSDDGPEAKP